MTKAPWNRLDIDTLTGDFVLMNEAGTRIAEIYHREDVRLIANAPEMYNLLKEYVLPSAMTLEELGMWRKTFIQRAAAICKEVAGEDNIHQS